MEEVGEKNVDKKQILLLEDRKRHFVTMLLDNPDILDYCIAHLSGTLNSTKLQASEAVTAELHIEERTNSHDPVEFRCNPNWTVRSAKNVIRDKFPFLEDHTMFILFKQMIAKDWVYLRDCGVEQNGDVLYVYVCLAGNANGKANKMGYKNRTVSSVRVKQKEYFHKDVQQEITHLEKQPSLFELSAFHTDGVSPTSMPALDFMEIQDSIGLENVWRCPNCSYPNEAVSTCQLCSTKRPVSSEAPIGGSLLSQRLDQSNILMKPQGQQINSMPGDSWQCIYCLTSNKLYDRVCGWCSKSRIMNNSEEKQVIEQPVKEVETATEQPNNLKLTKQILGWKCSTCTYVNLPTRPGCEMCSSQRPVDYIVPEDYIPPETEIDRMLKEKELEEEVRKQGSLERKENYKEHLSVIDKSIVTSMEPVECMICLMDTIPTDTVVLKECLHRFCKDCLIGHMINSEDAVVSCPFKDNEYSCNYMITDREIKALLDETQFQKYLKRSLSQAEKSSPNSFHCKTPDCTGWCLYEDEVNNFLCPVCKKTNCLVCKAIHENHTCKEYQDELQRNSGNDKDAQKTRKMLERMVKEGQAMHCPKCNIIIQKKMGCDWLRCSMCKLEICWVTRGPRWGPLGKGDVNGGCHCRENGRKCHENCKNCH